MATQTAALKACPYCGRSDTPCLGLGFGKINAVRNFVICDDLRGGCGARTKDFATQQEAMDAWNRRANNDEGQDA